jgi:hypothetical protein
LLIEPAAVNRSMMTCARSSAERRPIGFPARHQMADFGDVDFAAGPYTIHSGHHGWRRTCGSLRTHDRGRVDGGHVAVGRFDQVRDLAQAEAKAKQVSTCRSRSTSSAE